MRLMMPASATLALQMCIDASMAQFPQSIESKLAETIAPVGGRMPMERSYI
ncbi:hypothetical protein D3C85_1898450 [compost metagenome]